MITKAIAILHLVKLGLCREFISDSIDEASEAFNDLVDREYLTVAFQDNGDIKLIITHLGDQFLNGTLNRYKAS